MIQRIISLVFVLQFSIVSAFCQPGPVGSLFIIGGGNRPPALVQNMIDLAGLGSDGQIIILPMASAEPDTTVFYASQQFIKQGVSENQITAILKAPTELTETELAQISAASLIYICGGDQNRFMASLEGSHLLDALHKAYQNGAMIAGTSAGAAVMSRKMITGNSYKYPEYTGEFRSIEAENIEIADGLGLLPMVIIDQHFIYRMRMNRLMTVALEHPGYYAIGIDESTALFVRGQHYKVFGESQVVRIISPAPPNIKDGLLGGARLLLDVFLPGDSFRLEF
ncbi:MAG: cyanophycinase [Saprospiraceae bacterium]|nr:cyanophycinase [Saprospiraceae bacterium]